MKVRYKQAFDKIQFSKDFEQRVIDHLTMQPVLKNRNSFVKKHGFVLMPLCGILLACIACIIGLTLFNIQDTYYRILSKEEISKISDIEMVEIIQPEEKEKFLEINNQSLNAGEMLILDCDRTISGGDTVSLQGMMEGNDMRYDVGYILNGEFCYLQKSNEAELMDYKVVAKESGNFYWCINNISENTVFFSGTVQYASDDLVYRYYGDDAVYVDGACTIRLENIQTLLAKEKIKGIFLYDYDQKQTKEFSADTDTIVYRSEQGGAYCIYAITQEGETISLSSHISVEYEVEYHEESNDGKSITDGIINL